MIGKIEIAAVVSLLRNDRIDRRDACPTGDMRLPRSDKSEQ